MTTLNTLNTDMGDILLTSLRKPAQDCTITMPVVSGKSAYDLAVENGFVGNLDAWLASIKGWQPITSEEYMNLLNSTLKDSLLYTDLTSKINLIEIKFHDDIRNSLAAIQANKIELLEKHDIAVASIKQTQQELLAEVSARVGDALKAKQLLESEVEERKLAVLEAIDAIQQEQVTRVQELTLLNNKIVTEASDRLNGILNLGTQLEQESADRVKEVEAIYAQLKLDQDSYAEALTNLNDAITKDTQNKLNVILTGQSELQKAVKERIDLLDENILAIQQEQDTQVQELAKLNNDITTEAQTRLDELLKLTNTTKAIDEKVTGVFAQVNPEYIGKNSGSIGDTVKKVGVWTEYSARIEGDVALGSRIDNLVSQVGDNSAVISQVNKTLVDSNQSLASQITAIKTEFNGNTATITKNIESLTTKTDATNKLVAGMSSEFTDYKADVVTKYITKADSESSITEKLEGMKTSYISPLLDGAKKELASDYNQKIEAQSTELQTTVKVVEGLQSGYKDLAGNMVTAEKLDTYMTSSKAGEAITSVVSKYKTEVLDPVLNSKVSTETIKDYYNKSTADSAINTAVESFKADYVDKQLGLKASTNALSEIESKVTKTEQGLLATSTKLEGVFAQVNPEYAGTTTGFIGASSKQVGVWTEHSARIEGDSILGQRIDNLAVAHENNTATISETNKVLVDKTQSLASQITAIKAEYEGNTAKVTKDIEALVNSDKATSKVLEGIQSNFNDYKADIVKTYITTADANSAITQGLETFKAEQLIPTVTGETAKLASTYDKLLETEVKDGVTTSKRLDGLESKYTDLSGKAVTAEALDSFITSAKADEAITNVISKYKTEIIDPILGTKVSSETIKDYYNKSTTDEVINDALVEYKTSYVDPQLNLKASTKAVEEVQNSITKVNGDLTATSTKLDGVFAQVNPEYAGTTVGFIGSESKRVGVWTETSARIEKDSSIGQRIDNLVVEHDKNTAAIVETNKVLVDKTQALAEKITAVNSEFLSNSSKFTQEIKSVTDANKATSDAVKSLTSNFGDYKAEVIDKYTTKADSESALTTALEGFKSAYVDPVEDSRKTMESTYNKLLDTYSDATGTHSKKLESLESKYVDLDGKAITADTFTSNLTKASSTEAITNVIEGYKTEILDPVLNTKVSTETIKDYYNKSDTKDAINTALEEYTAEIIDPALNQKASASAVEQIESKVNNSSTGLEATVRKLDGVFLKVNPAYAGASTGSVGASTSQVGVWTETSGRIEEDYALGQRIDNLNVEVKGNAASIVTLTKAVVDTEKALASKVDVLNTNFGDFKNTSSKTIESLSTASESYGKSIASLDSKYSGLTKNAESTVLSDYYTSTKADEVIAGKITEFKTSYVDEQLKLKVEAKAFDDLKVAVENKDTGLRAVGEKLNGFILKNTPEYVGSDIGSVGKETSSVGVWTQYTAMLEKDIATAKRVDNLDIKLEDSTAVINTTNKIIVDKLKSLAERTDVIETQFDGKNPASIKSQVQAVSTATGSSTRFLKLLNSKFETATTSSETSILDGFYTSTQTDGAIVAKINELKTDYIDTNLELKASASAFSNLEAVVNNTDRGLVATATKLDGVYLQVNPLLAGRNYGSIGDTRVTNNVGAWSEYSARLEDNYAQAKKNDIVTTKLDDNTATIQTQQESLNGLSAKWTVKMDINGRAVGFGLAADSSGADPRSEFAVVADKFYIASPNDTGKGKLLFQVLSAPVTVDNITIPAGVYMDGAFIRYASIDTAHIRDGAIVSAKIFDAAIVSAKIADLAVTNAKIADLTVTGAKIANATITDAKIGNLDAAKITTGYLSADRINADTITTKHIKVKSIEPTHFSQQTVGYFYETFVPIEDAYTDGKLTPVEKRSMKEQLSFMTAVVDTNKTSASMLGVTDCVYTAHADLIAYTETLDLDDPTVTDIDRTLFKSKLDAYYAELAANDNKLFKKVKDLNGESIREAKKATDLLKAWKEYGQDSLYIDDTKLAIKMIAADQIAADAITGDKIKANTEITAPKIKGGEININENFKVDSQGNLTARSGTFEGTVLAENISGTIDVASLKKSAWMGGYNLHLKHGGYIDYATYRPTVIPSRGAILSTFPEFFQIAELTYTIHLETKYALNITQFLSRVDDALDINVYQYGSLTYTINYTSGNRREISIPLPKGFCTLEFKVKNTKGGASGLVLLGDFVDNDAIKFA